MQAVQAALQHRPEPARTRDDGHGVDLLQHQLLCLAQQLPRQHNDRGRAVAHLRVLHLANVCAPPRCAASRPGSRAPDVVPPHPGLCSACAAPRGHCHAFVRGMSCRLTSVRPPQAYCQATDWWCGSPPAFCSSACQRNSWKHCAFKQLACSCPYLHALLRSAYGQGLFYCEARGSCCLLSTGLPACAGRRAGHSSLLRPGASRGPHLRAPLQPDCLRRAT